MSARMLLDFCLVTSSTSYAIWTASVPQFLLSIHGLRGELVSKSSPCSPDDPQYLRHLKRKFHSFPDVYPRELKLFQEVLEEEDFLKWYSDTPQYVFEEGQAPQPQDFSAPDRFLGPKPQTQSGEAKPPARAQPGSN